MDYRSQLATLAQVYAAATKRSISRVATLAAGSGVFFDRLNAGGSCSVDTYLSVKKWFSDQWPSDLAWPAGVDRPDVLPTIPTLTCGLTSIQMETRPTPNRKD